MSEVISEKKTIAVGETLSEAWQLVAGFKLPIIRITLLLMLIWMGNVILQMVLLFSFKFQNDPLIYLAAKIPIGLLSWWLFAMMIILGVRRAIGLPTQLSAAFSDCMRVKEPLFYLMLVSLSIGGIYLGLRSATHSFAPSLSFLYWPINIAMLVVYFYLSLLTHVFALPLIVTKRCTVMAALVSAWEDMKRYWFPAVIGFAIVNVIVIISMLPLGIGLIWTMPMYAALFGVFFKKAYGLSAKKQTHTQRPNPDRCSAIAK